MKLLRVGNLNEEKPALLDNQNNFRDLSSIIEDFNPEIGRASCRERV